MRWRQHSHTFNLRHLRDYQSARRSGSCTGYAAGARRDADLNTLRGRIVLELLERPRVEREQVPQRRHINAPPNRVHHANAHRRAIAQHLSAKRLPTKRVEVYEEHARPHSEPDEVGPVIAGVAIPFQRVRE